MTKQETCYKLINEKKLIKQKGGNKLLDIKTSNGVVAHQVKKIIKCKGLKQTVLAQRAGFTTQEFNDMLNGRRLMRAVDIAAIINALKEVDVGVDANYLFSADEEVK